MHCFTCVVVLLASCVAVIMTNPLPVAQSSPEVSTEGSGQKQMAASIMALYRHAVCLHACLYYSITHDLSCYR